MSKTLDIFISYAHADDEVPQGAKAGWVTTLVGELKKILRRKLGGSGAEIWMDHQLAANENVSEELLDKLRASRILVFVMSPGYQRSRWTQRELVNFLLSENAAKSRNNVFLVEIEPIERATWPKSLRDLELTPVRFWHREFDDAAPNLLGYPVPPLDGVSLYWRNLNELAHWIAARLAEKSPVSEAQRLVVVAETTDDLDDQREAVAALLRQHQFEPVPVRGYPRDTEEAYLHALRGDLREAKLFVQLLGRYEGKRLPDGAASVVALQAREAVAAHGDRALKLLQWRDPTLDLEQIASNAHRALLSGPFVRASGFEQFRHEILRTLSAEGARREAAPDVAITVHSEKPISIFVDADVVDSDLAAAIGDALKTYDIDVVLARAMAGPGSFARRLSQQRETIRRCRGVIFVYGRTTLSWLSARFAYAAQAMGLRRDDVWGAVLDGPPAADSKVPFRNKNLLNLDCRDGFDPAKLNVFLATLGIRLGGISV